MEIGVGRSIRTAGSTLSPAPILPHPPKQILAVHIPHNPIVFSLHLKSALCCHLPSFF